MINSVVLFWALQFWAKLQTSQLYKMLVNIVHYLFWDLQLATGEYWISAFSILTLHPQKTPTKKQQPKNKVHTQTHTHTHTHTHTVWQVVHVSVTVQERCLFWCKLCSCLFYCWSVRLWNLVTCRARKSKYRFLLCFNICIGHISTCICNYLQDIVLNMAHIV